MGRAKGPGLTREQYLDVELVLAQAQMTELSGLVVIC